MIAKPAELFRVSLQTIHRSLAALNGRSHTDADGVRRPGPVQADFQPAAGPVQVHVGRFVQDVAFHFGSAFSLEGRNRSPVTQICATNQRSQAVRGQPADTEQYHEIGRSQKNEAEFPAELNAETTPPRPVSDRAGRQ